MGRARVVDAVVVVDERTEQLAIGLAATTDVDEPSAEVLPSTVQQVLLQDPVHQQVLGCAVDDAEHEGTRPAKEMREAGLRRQCSIETVALSG